MPKMIGINVGFITNSSSVVHHFPRILLEDPQVKSFIDAMQIQDGFIGNELWHRAECETFAVTREQKEKVQASLNDPEYGGSGPAIDVESDKVVVIYGDEYDGLAQTLADLLHAAAERAGIKRSGGQDYN